MMGFLFKKKEVPSELPDLISDEIASQLKKEFEETKRESEASSYPEKKTSQVQQSSFSSQILDSSSESEGVALKKLPTSQENEPGYFRELVKSVMAEDPAKLGNKWQSKFMSKDVVTNMKQYWEKQSPEMILNSIGGETKEALLKQVEKLHTLEKEWQNNYLSLIACEEKIRDEEKQLKGALNEFISLYKRNLNRKRK